MVLNDTTRKNLKTWLEKSLANHHEDGLVAYIEALVGDADGADDDLLEKLTGRLDDFLADSSAEFAKLLLRCVRTGSFGQPWRGASGGVNVSRDGGNENQSVVDGNANYSTAEARDEPDYSEDAQNDTAEANRWVGQSGSVEDNEDEEVGGPRSRLNRSREREREEREEADDRSTGTVYNGKDAGAAGGSGSIKRARVHDSRGNGGADNRNIGESRESARGTNRVSGGRGQPGAPGSVSPQNQNPLSGRRGTGMGSLATVGQPMGPSRQGAIPWGPNVNGAIGPRGMPQGGFPPRGFPGPSGMANSPPMGGTPMTIGPHHGLGAGIVGGPRSSQGPRPGDSGEGFEGTQSQPRGSGGLLPTPYVARGISGQGAGRGGVALLPGPPIVNNSGTMAPRPGGRGMGLLGPPGGFQGPRVSPPGYMGPGGPVGFDGPRGPGGPVGPGEPTGPGGQVGPGPQGPGGLVGPVGPRGQITPRGAGGPGGPGELEGPVGLGGASGPRGPAGPWGTSGQDTSVNQGASVGPRASLISRGPSGARGHGGRSGGAASTGNGGLLDMQDNQAPINRGRDGGPVLDRPPPGRHPDVGLGPGQQTFGGPAAGPEFLVERGGNGAGGSLRHGSQGSYNVQNTRTGGGAFGGGDIQRGMGPGTRQASRQVLDDRTQLSGQQGSDAQVARSGGMHASESRGNMMHPSMEPREMQGVRPGSEIRERNDGQSQISIRQGVSSRAELRHGIQESESIPMRGGQDFRPSPLQRDGHLNMQGAAEIQGINRTGDKNGRSVFGRLGARPSPEARGPREVPHLSMVAKQVHGSDLRQQGPETRDVSRDLQRSQNMGITEDIQHRRDDVHHGESMDRSTTRGLAGEDDPRDGSRGRQQAWHAPNTRVGARGPGAAAHREEQTLASIPGRGISPGRNQTFTRGDQVRAVPHRDRQQDGVDMGTGGQRVGSMPREVSPKHPGGQADVRHMNIGHPHIGSALRETMEQYDSGRAYDHGTRDTQVDFSSRPASGVGRNNIQMGSSSRDGASPMDTEVVNKRVAQVPSRHGVDAGPVYHGERGRPMGTGADAMSSLRRPGGRIGGDGDEARFDVPTDGVREAGGSSAWGGIGMVKEENNSIRVRRRQLSTRSGGSGSLIGNSDDARSGPDRPDQSEERSFVQGRRGNEDPADGRLYSAQGHSSDSSGRDWGTLRGRRPGYERERGDDGHEHPAKRKELTRVADFSARDADSRWMGHGHGNGNEHFRGNYEEKRVPGRQTGALPPSERVTVRCEKIPGEYGIAELKQHFIAFGELVDIKLRLVLAEEGGNGEQEALVQFASADQAQACLASPKAVLGNRFIVVVQSPVNLHPVKNSHVGEEDLGVVYASESADTVTEQEVHSKAKAAVAAALADRKSAHEQQMALASKTQDIVKQQLLVMQLRERMDSATQSLNENREKVEKLQDFLKMMDHKGKPEAEKDVYRKKLQVFSSKVRGHEADIADLERQSRILADLEKEARAMGATIPPPPNPALHARTVGTARGVATDQAAGSGRGYGRGRGHSGPAMPASTMAGAGRGGANVSGTGANSMQDADPRLAFTLDNRPTALRVTGMPESAGEADLRLYSDVFGVVLAATMLDTPGEGLVKFADRRAAEVFISKSRTFGGFPIRVSWYTEPFPDNTALDRPSKRMRPPLRTSGRTSSAAGGGGGVAGGAHVTSTAGRARGGVRVDTWHLGQRNAVEGAATAAQGAHRREMFHTEESKAAR